MVSAVAAFKKFAHCRYIIGLFIVMIPIVAVLVYFLGAGHIVLSQDVMEEQCGPVIYLNAMFRHGARNTDGTPPKDPYSDPKYWPGGFGALTAEGVLQHYRLGKWVAKRYRHLLPDDWVDINSALRVVSTDWNRTLMSAQSEMASMFPITQNTEYWEGLTSYPVPIHSLPTDDDALLEVTKECKRYAALMQASIASEKYISVMQKYENMTQYIEENSGAAIKTLDDYQNLFTNYYIEEGRGLELPDWLSKVYPSPMVEPAVISFVTPTWDDGLKRFRGGPFVKEVLGNFRGKLNGSNPLNMSMYSAHDTSLSAVMNTMGVFNDAVPPFAALLLIELRMPENFSEPLVTMWYKNTTTDPFLLELPDCGACCPLGQMERQLKPVIPDDWEKECEENPSGPDEESKSFESLVNEVEFSVGPYSQSFDEYFRYNGSVRIFLKSPRMILGIVHYDNSSLINARENLREPVLECCRVHLFMTVPGFLRLEGPETIIQKPCFTSNVGPVSLKKALSSVSRSQWIVIIFIVAMIPIVAIVVYFLNMDSNIEPRDSLEEYYGRVIYVNMMFRHGERNTDRTPPNDPYSDIKYWPGGFGALTTKGILQHYRLGKWIAERYRHLLPDTWLSINDAVRVVSTDWKRTLMSAEANLAGMFPITQNSEMWEGLTSYPVPVHSLPSDEDGLLELSKECKKYRALAQAARASEKYQSILRMFRNTSDYIEQNSGDTITDLKHYRSLYTVYYIEENKGLALPKWLEKVYPSPMRELAVMSLVTPTWDTDLKRLRGGPFLKEVLGNFRGKLNGTQSLNISMYSAHDTSLSAAMGAMDVFNNEFPPFAALLILELRMPKNETEPAVMVWYKNTTGDPFLLSLPGCSAACPLSEMEQLLKPVIPDDWDKECQEVPATGL